MKTEDFIAKIISYISEDVIPTINSDTSKFRIGFALPVIAKMAKDWFRDTGSLFCNGDEIDIELLKSCIESGFETGSEPSLFGFKLEKKDFENFINKLYT